MGWQIFEITKCISVDRKILVQYIKKPVNLLKEHKTIGIFPTGHRIMLGMALLPNQIHYMAKKNYLRISGLANF